METGQDKVRLGSDTYIFRIFLLPNLARLNIFTKGDSRTFMISVKRVQFIFAWDFAAVLIIGVSAMRDLTVSTRKKPRTSRNK